MQCKYYLIFDYVERVYDATLSGQSHVDEVRDQVSRLWEPINDWPTILIGYLQQHTLYRHGVALPDHYRIHGHLI